MPRSLVRITPVVVLLGFACLSLVFETTAAQTEPVVELFFDGAGDPRLLNAALGEPAIDSQGRLVVPSSHYDPASCAFGYCMRLNAISSSGTLIWQTPRLGPSPPDGNRRVTLASDDRAYVHTSYGSRLYAVEPNGTLVPGWPVTTPYDITENGVLVDARDDAVYIRSAFPGCCSTPHPTTIARYRPDGSVVWQRNYADGQNRVDNGIVQGPARHIYVDLTGRVTPPRFVGLEHGNGSEVCNVPRPPSEVFRGFVGGLDAMFAGTSSFLTGGGIVSYDVNCMRRNVFAPSREYIVYVLRVGGDTIVAMDGVSHQQLQLFAVSKSGSLLWRHTNIDPRANGSRVSMLYNNSVFYIFGTDRQDRTDKLFLIHGTSGTILQSIPTGALCRLSYCRAAVTEDGTVYITNALGNRIYKLSSSHSRQTVFLVHGIAQGGDRDGPALRQFAQNLRNSLDPARFIVDAGFDYGACAVPTNCSATCSITDGAQRLARYIRESHPVGDIILVGYSMGGLIARDLLINHAELFEGLRVSLLVTLGTPHLGYPYDPVADDLARCRHLAKEMFGDFNHDADPERGEIDFYNEKGQWVAALSSYLYNLNSRWVAGEALGAGPDTWFAAAGTFCGQPVRQFPLSLKGCHRDTWNDGVVCEQSAAFDIGANAGWPEPDYQWPDPDYAHIDNWGSWFVFCGNPAGRPGLSNPEPGSNLFRIITGLIQQAK